MELSLSENEFYFTYYLPYCFKNNKEGNRASGRSALIVWHDDDDDDFERNGIFDFRKNYTFIRQGCCEQYWTSPGGSTHTKQQLYSHLPPIMKTINIKRTRHAGHRWRSRDEIISDILLWTTSHGRAKAGRPAWTYIRQLCADTRCSLENLPEAMDDRAGWQESVREIRADCVTWWWWWWLWKKWHFRFQEKSYIYKTRMLRAILNKSWREYPTKQQLYSHLPPITKTINVRRTRHAGHCWRSRDEIISDLLLWTTSHGRAKAGRPAWTYI